MNAISTYFKGQNVVDKQLMSGPPPGPPPRPGLEWKPQTHRWIRPDKESAKPKSTIAAVMDSAMETLMAKYKVDGNEHSIVLSSEGKHLLAKSGHKTGVGFLPEEILYMEGAILVHNHPSSSSFSVEDVAMTAFSNLREISVVSEKYRYRLYRKGSDWVYPFMDIGQRLKDHRDHLFPKYQKIYQENRDSDLTAQMHSHEAMIEFAKDLNHVLTYERQEIVHA